jgi:HK97 gp10 family phage protein
MAVETVKIIGLEGVMRALRELPPELVSKRGGPVRTALRKASLLMLNEMKSNLQQIVDEPNIGGDNYSTGFLKKNIVTTRDSKMRQKGERYIVRVRKKAYPKPSPNAKRVTTSQVGALLEYGTEKRQPMPWVRPAFDAKKHQVIPLFVLELRANLDRIVKKLAKQNGVA